MQGPKNEKAGIFLKFLFIFSITISIIFTSNKFSTAQSDSDSAVKSEFDMKDLLRDIFKSKKKPSLDTLNIIKTKNNVSLSLLPGLSYNPATSVIIGVSASVSWYMGSLKTTTNSSIASSVSYSLKNQLKVSVQSSVFTKNNKWSLQGDWRFWKFNQVTYGLGTGSLYTGGENMNFKLIRFKETVLKEVVKNLYGGIGYSLDSYFNINTVDDNDSLLYPNYNDSYSSLHGFDSSSYLVSGIVGTVNYDSRDNTINPYKGLYIQATYTNYNTIFGSSANSQVFTYQARNYQSLNKKSTYILAFWLLGGNTINGRLPYMVLPAIGWDKYNATGRGYIQGRFRGEQFMYFELENRITITKNRFFGIVIFANAESLSNTDTGEKLFKYIEPAGGIGLRFLFDKYSRTNLCIDYGIGRHSSGVFLSLGEFF